MTPNPLNFNTPDVGYSTVIEDVCDGNNNLLKRTRYRYTNYNTDLNNISHMCKHPHFVALPKNRTVYN